MKIIGRLIAATALGLVLHSTAFADISSTKVERSTPETLAITWTSADPVDVYAAEKPDAALKDAHILARGRADGAYAIDHADRTRRYFILVDTRDRKQIVVAERVLPLAQGSNFRDVGGYVGAGGKRVRWGAIYRSGGQPLLTPQDVDQIKALGVSQLVDLRSSEERVIAPSKITGVPYTAVGYSLGDVLGPAGPNQLGNGADVYRKFPRLLAPQLKVIFADLLRRQTPIVYNCSAGQDRTGFTTAIILSALGVSRDDIVADYKLSTLYRRPQFEMAKLDAAAYPDDPIVQLFARYQQAPNWLTPDPLVDADGRPFLRGAFEEIDAKWGSVEVYLDKEVGVGPADIARLRGLYLE